MQMTVTDENSYRNPSYNHDESKTCDGPDSRSSNSSYSSQSSMKTIGTKLQRQRGKLWLVIAIILVVIVAVVTVSLAIYFSQGSWNREQVKQAGIVGDTVFNDTTLEMSLKKQYSLDTAMTSNKPSKRPKNENVTNTPTATTQEEFVPIQMNTWTNLNNVPVEHTEATHKTATAVTYGSTTTVNTTAVLHTSPTMNMNHTGNVSERLSEIPYNPDEVKELTVQCRARYHGDWETMIVSRHFKDSVNTLIVVGRRLLDVTVLHPNIIYHISVHNESMVLTLRFKQFTCEDLANYTCTVRHALENALEKADISIFMPDINMEVPHAIVEGKEIDLECTAKVWQSSATIVWKFKPQNSTQYLDFSIYPVTDVIKNNCSTLIKSVMTFTPTTFENSSNFRCQLQYNWTDPLVVQKDYVDTKLLVVPSNYCEGKQHFNIHPHPFGPCTLVVYCLDTSPLVYEVECEPGQCYDYVKTACVSNATMSKA